MDNNKDIILPKDLHEKVRRTEFHQVGEKTTICVLILKNGFEIVSSSAPVSVRHYHRPHEEEICRHKALKKLWLLEGYLLQEQRINVRKV